MIDKTDDLSENKTNIVVGRFQSPTLTEDQKNLLDYSLSTSRTRPTVVLGLSPLKCTAANPLDYESRKAMIEAAYPDSFNFKYIKDQNSDEVWSNNFDNIVSQCLNVFDAQDSFKILGSKDGFLDHYTGEYANNFEEHTQTSYSSIVEQTKAYAKNVKNTPEWRAGVAYAVSSQYPTVYPTVDCAIFDKDDFKQIYLARKKDEKLYRFVGGFADPNDDSFEESALREAKEETGLKCKNVKYLFSQKIDDFRYRNEKSKIITHMFSMVKENGRACANDDICELKLFNFNDLTEDMLQEEHRILLRRLKDKIVLEDDNEGWPAPNTKECLDACWEEHEFDFCDKCQKCKPELIQSYTPKNFN